jgi:hypothetical protein
MGTLNPHLPKRTIAGGCLNGSKNRMEADLA